MYTEQESSTTRSVLKSKNEIPLYKPKKVPGEPAPDYPRQPMTFHLQPYRQLGSIYRVNFPLNIYLQASVVIAGPEANAFVAQNPDIWNYGKRMKVFKEGFNEDCILQLDGEAHQRKRKCFVQGFKPNVLLSLIPKMNEPVQQEIASLAGAEVDLREFCKIMMLRMTSRALLGMEPPDSFEGQMDAFSHNILLGQTLGTFRHLWNALPGPRKARKNLFKSIVQMIEDREANPSPEPDMMSFIVKAMNATGEPVSQLDIAVDALFLLQAGTQTASAVLLWILLYLHHHPQWLAEIREELQSWTPEAPWNLNDWPKAKATIQEVERLMPPLPFLGLVPQEDIVYQGYQIPKGTSIYYAMALPHVMEEIFEDPLSFKPERFLGAHSHPAGSTATFGNNSHSCTGLTLAHMKLFLCMANIIKHFDIQFDQEPTLMPFLDVATTPDAKRIPARFLARKDEKQPSQSV